MKFTVRTSEEPKGGTQEGVQGVDRTEDHYGRRRLHSLLLLLLLASYYTEYLVLALLLLL